jgi:GABA(A) receptor-associated protein
LSSILLFFIKDKNSKLPDLHKTKFLVPNDITVSQFIYVIRRHIKLESPHQAIFLLINDTSPMSSEVLQNVYIKHKNEDGFLYITYAFENTFG